MKREITRNITIKQTGKINIKIKKINKTYIK